MYKKLILVTAVLGLTGCFEGDEFSDEELSRAVLCTNQDVTSCSSDYQLGSWSQLQDGKCTMGGTYCFEDGSLPPQTLALTRWRQGDLIPVYYREKDDPRFTQAMERAEAIVGYKLFDFKGVVELDVSDPANVDYSQLETDWGFIWSQGTSIGGKAGGCSSGTVSNQPFHYTTASYLVHIDYGIIQGVANFNDHNFTWLNIDSVAGANGGEINCSSHADYDVVLHELGHAMGMQNHFDGFGNGDGWGINAERVLRTMYHPQNPPGQPFDALYLP